METCAVCGSELSENARRIGERFFCEPHFKRAIGSRKGVYFGTAAGIAGNCLLAALVGIAFGSHVVQSTLGGRLIAMLLAGLPGLVWLAVFYRLDLIEPEPIPMVLGIFALGALLEGALVLPLGSQVFPEVAFATAGRPALDFLQSVLFGGTARVLFLFLGLRLILYANPEFDEKVDGIIYGSAIGLGAGVMANMSLVLASEGIWLWSTGFDFSVNSLSGACTGAMVGYALAKVKFEGLGAWQTIWLLVIAAGIEGITGAVSDFHFMIGLHFFPWLKLVIVTAICLIAFTALFLVSLSEARKTLASAILESA